MKKVLFVTNGHGEIAIAARIASELKRYGVESVDHLPLVGTAAHAAGMRAVGPSRQMPSGGLVAMGNVRNLARDVAAGLFALTFAQWKYLRSVRASYDTAVAVGDVYALMMARVARARSTIFVGTAKSVFVAPYGPRERALIKTASAAFVRDEATAAWLRDRDISARAANVIVDLQEDASGDMPGAAGDPLIAVLPGSRGDAYGDARFLLSVFAAVAQRRPQAYALISVAPGLRPDRFVSGFRTDGWRVGERSDARSPFRLFLGDREVARAWQGSIAGALEGAHLALGQAGTANEAAAAAGVPVVAFETLRGKSTWYRRRQAGLLGEALLIAPRTAADGARAVNDLLDDPARLSAMSAAGRLRMGEPGGARAIAAAVAAV